MSDEVGQPSLRAVGKVLEALSYIAGVCSLVLIAFQLASDAQDRRVVNTMQLVERFNSSPMSEYHATLLRPWLSRTNELAMIQRAGGLSDDDANAFVSLVVEDYHRNHPSENIYLAIQRVADFYSQVYICLASGICDWAIASSYFAGPARRYYCLYGAIVREQAGVFNNPELARRLTGIGRLVSCR